MVNWNARLEGWKPEQGDVRSAYEIDYGRVIHSASFRRLQGKTQILNLGDSDFYRTRLTHSMEVAQISYGLVRQLQQFEEVQNYLPSQSLMQTIGLIHDLGHPPFGHGGEVALNYCMRSHGGFEGNGQTLRILSRLEKFSGRAGSNLTRRTLLGCLKYPAAYSEVANPDITPSKQNSVTGVNLLDRKTCKPPKCYLNNEKDVVKWIINEFDEADQNELIRFDKKKDKHSATRHKALDCSIMDIADDISNGVHDLEDAISMGLITDQDFRRLVRLDGCRAYLDWLVSRYPKEFGSNSVYETFIHKLFHDGGSIRKRQISRLINYFISNVKVLDKGLIFKEPLLRYNATLPTHIMAFALKLKDFVYQAVIASPNVQHMEFKGQQMVVDVFDIIAHEPKRFLEPKTYDTFKEAGDDGLRVLCDHISGMTDNYLLHLYERLLSPRMGSVFDKL
ncbi:dGTPase [Kordiimonas sediminis]|uniref:Deoxyguanosinetriphosphate triphosphohydrolase-like protein n=1 Tax=Kordiimonas sediminis TaxID=1735581 RepID=A0A919E6U3_9PROT|nr:anti-phage deoxyguanosine triphosphatase [Kordiimonas sediminis]GHF24872.1 dGTPase [Kordiimonas sediminis]